MSYAKPKRKEKFKSKWGGGPFNALSWRFTRSHVLRNLGPFACKLFLDLQAQYNGFNNGDLCITWSIMQKGAWRSRTTLQRAKQRLLDVDLIICTRPGTRRRCALYALTIYDIDDCKGKHDIEPTSKPPNSWLKHEPVRPLSELQAESRAKQEQNVQNTA